MPGHLREYQHVGPNRKLDPLASLLAAARRRREQMGIEGDHPELTRRDCAVAALALLAGLALEAARIGEVRR